MRKIKLPKINKSKWLRTAAFAVCFAILIAAPIIATVEKNQAAAQDEMTVLTVWQIDGFEGGKGSRASYLQNVANKFSDDTACYFNVIALTSDAARLNISKGNLPDIISYAAGTYGIENLIHGETPYYNWCRGGYCLLSVTEGADFSDCTAENTVINGGTDNLAGAAALFCGLSGAKTDKPTGAYVKLINGEYKYLLGTQRDIYRLKTRGVAFSIKPITEFNDLYQNISVVTTNAKKSLWAKEFIAYLIDKSGNLGDLGLFSDFLKIYDDELSSMEELEFKYKLKSPISENLKRELEEAIRNCDENKLKNLLN